MNSPIESFHELHELLTALCDGPISEDQIQRLEELVCGDQASRWYYVRHMHLHSNLSRYVRVDLDDLTFVGVGTESADEELAGAAAEQGKIESCQKALATRRDPVHRSWPIHLSWLRNRKIAYAATAAIILLFFVVADGLLPKISVSSQAFATVLQQLRTARVISYTAEFQEGGEVVRVSETLHLQPDLVREELSDGCIKIIDFTKRKNITLDHVHRKAVVFEEINFVPTYKQERFLDKIKEYIERISTNPLSTDRYLGKRKIDGRTLEGYEMQKPTQVQTLWVDVETGLLTEMKIADPKDLSRFMVMRNFQFDVEAYESFFSLEPPLGYEVSYETVEYTKQVDDKVKMIPR